MANFIRNHIDKQVFNIVDLSTMSLSTLWRKRIALVSGSFNQLSIRMKLVDCFTFYNELTLLKYRLALLDPVVDTFIIAEANQTHMGYKKELYSQQLKEVFEKYNHKIIHLVIDLPYTHDILNLEQENQWDNERYQRNALQRGILSLELDDTDVVIISDMDEIPDPDTLSKIKSGDTEVSINSLEQDFYYYNLRSQFIRKWYSAKVISYREFINLGISCSSIRSHATTLSIPKGGWHLSYFGDTQFITNKLQNFAHNEHNTSTTIDPKNIQKCIDTTVCLVGDSYKMLHKPITENLYLPPYYTHYLKEFI